MAGNGPRRRGRGGRCVVPADVPHGEADRNRMAEMTRSAFSPALLLLLAGPLAGQTSLSIYSDGRAVVRRTLPQALAKGRNALTLELDGVDPATVFSPDTAEARGAAGPRAPTGHGVGRAMPGGAAP